MAEWFLLWRWWLVLEILGFVVFPIVALAGRDLEDKGYCIAKPLGLLLVSYVVWLVSSARLMRFGYLSIIVALLLVGALAFLLNRKTFSLREMPWKNMAAADLVFLAAFVLFAWILRHKPDLYFAYSEDFVDFAFTQSVLRTDYFPPQDPWMSGQPVSYYYGGFLLAANLIKMSHIPASFVSNFVVASFFGLTATAAYGLAANITRSKASGLLAALLVCGAGYLSGAFQFIAAWTKQDFMGYKPLLTSGWKEWLLSFNFWDANRIIPGTLNYYPYFSFLQSDMHPPTLSYPFQASFLVLLLMFIRAPVSLKKPGRGTSVLGFLMAVNLGFLFFIHSWDFPIYIMALGLAAILFQRSWIRLLAAAAIIAGSLVLFLPYTLQGVGGGFQGIGIVAERTPISSILEMLGPLLFIIVSMLIIVSARAQLKGYQCALFASLGLIAIPVFKFPLLVFLLPMVAVPAYLILKKDTSENVTLSRSPERSEGAGEGSFVPARPNDSVPMHRDASLRSGLRLRVTFSEQHKVLLFFVMLGALVIFFAEVFYLRDALRGPVARFNTVLKLYYAVWLFLGLAAALAFRYTALKLTGGVRYLWLFPAIVLLAASLVHPLAATAGWTSGRHAIFGVGRGTWDGTAYIKTVNPADYEAAAWINQNVRGTPVILEMPGGPYSYSSRVATLTGLPTLIGWGMHEIMWRGDWGGVGQRTNDADTIYNSRNDAQTMELLRKYGVRYVYIGSLETQKYSPDGLAKFTQRPDLFRSIYDNGGARIYEVIYGP